VDLSTGNTQASLNGVPLDDISGTLEFYGDHKNCTLQAHLASSSGAGIDLSGACGPGATITGQAIMNGQSMPVSFTLRSTQAPQGYTGLTGLLISGPIGASGTLSTRIALISPAA
jgi:hypothetical protein